MEGPDPTCIWNIYTGIGEYDADATYIISFISFTIKLRILNYYIIYVT